MKYLLLVYIDPELLQKVPAEEYDAEMRHCIRHAMSLAERGTIVGFSKLEEPKQARTVRVREGRTAVFDGPFAETKEVLAGYNLVEADSMEEAVELAKQFPWARYGSMEVRPVADMDAERVRVGA
ncbi:YciI family protein [Pseudoxanthomonas suwonensis]|uniref:YciI family protein n=1 Tax=Pseudoxanthomonas suwonensis TaxID=314722 RepID=UPI000464AD06|nr:YciI family protein [Pseudoxanthomonas suwonensis]